MAAVVYLAYNPTGATIGSGGFAIPGKSIAEVTLDDTTGIANFKTLLDSGAILVRKANLGGLQDRDALRNALREAGLHQPGK